MSTRFSFAVLTAMALLPLTVMAGVPDTVRIGDGYGYMASDYDFMVRLYVSNPNDTLQDVMVPYVFTCNGDPILPDSVLLVGRLVGADPSWSAAGYVERSDQPSNPPDSAILLVASAKPGQRLSPGAGIVAELWFTGGHAGDQVQFEIRDSMWSVGQGAFMRLSAHKSDETELPLIGVNSTITLTKPGQPLINCPTEVSGLTQRQVQIPVSVDADGSPVSLELLSFTGPGGPTTLPGLAGNNPWTITWVPAVSDTGTYILLMRATSLTGATSQSGIAIYISAAPLLRGDVNCDGVINLSDLSWLISFLLSNAGLPICP